MPIFHRSGQITSKRTAPGPTMPSMAFPTRIGTTSVKTTVTAESPSESSTSHRYRPMRRSTFFIVATWLPEVFVFFIVLSF